MIRFRYFLILLSLMSCNKAAIDTSTVSIDSIPETHYYDKEILLANNLKIYGAWTFLNIYSDAGIIAGPGKISPTYDYLLIKKFGIYGMIKDNKIIESGRIQIIKQADNQLEIQLNSDSADSSKFTSITWLVNYQGNDSMLLIDASVGCGTYYNIYQRKK
jgi:hypothetical protein